MKNSYNIILFCPQHGGHHVANLLNLSFGSVNKKEIIDIYNTNPKLILGHREYTKKRLMNDIVYFEIKNATNNNVVSAFHFEHMEMFYFDMKKVWKDYAIKNLFVITTILDKNHIVWKRDPDFTFDKQKQNYHIYNQRVCERLFNEWNVKEIMGENLFTDNLDLITTNINIDKNLEPIHKLWFNKILEQVND